MSLKIETLHQPASNEDSLPFDTVFHLTPASNAPSILENGLQPHPERGKKESWRNLEKFMDEIRPEHIRDLGISRRNGVFAYPDIEALKPRYVCLRDYERFTDNKRRAMDDTAFAIDVDPTQVMVFDMGDLDRVEDKLVDDEYFGRTGPDSKALKAGLRYWHNGLTLEEFRRRYETKHDENFSTTTLKDGYPDLKYRYLTPEVIVPGPIVGDRVNWAASKITLKDVELV